MQLLNDMLAYWNGTQAEYTDYNFNQAPYEEDFRKYSKDECFSLLHINDDQTLPNAKDISKLSNKNRGLLLHKDKLYAFDESGEINEIIPSADTQDVYDGAIKEIKEQQEKTVTLTSGQEPLYSSIEKITTFKPRKQEQELKSRYEYLWRDFEAKIKALEQREPASELLLKAKQARREIKEIADKQFSGNGISYEKEKIEKLNQVLVRCTLALTPPSANDANEINKYNENAAQLALLSKTLPGYAGMGWKILAGVLAFIAVQAIMLGIILSCGSAIPLGFIGAMGVTWILSSMTAAAAPLAGVIGHGVTATAVASTLSIGGGSVVGGATWLTGFYKNKVLAKAVDELATEIKKPKP